ncbi:ABC transporter ATP-binding protein [Erysipelotrichaceae bacterium OH741_COT-311]|nr:ABC transporter ATP-binding protein [Erysipelotrichaceae bacterium OH741_COT-311]
MSVLKVEGLGINFGGLRAVDRFHIEIKEKELVGLIGPNGAGKTTVFNLLTGVYAPSDGSILLNGESIVGLSVDAIAEKGIARTFQNIRLFNELSVLDNVKIGMHTHIKYSFVDGLFKTKTYFKQEELMNQEALRLLKLFHLDQYQDYKAGNLPYGKQRELEIVRALASNPKLLLLDEPAAGMNPNETLELMKTIDKIQKEFNIAILLIEHDMKLVMGICKKITVLNYGTVLASGSKEEILNNKQVIRAYLGE